MRSFLNFIFFKILSTTIYSTVALTFCAWIIQSSRYLNILNNTNISLAYFFKFTSFLSIDIIAFILPISLSVSAAFVYHRLVESNQILVLQSSGLALQKLIKPLIYLVILCSGYLYLSASFISPLAWREFRQMEYNIKNNIQPPNSAGLIFSNSNFSVYAQKYLGDFFFGNIFVIDSRNPLKGYTFFSKLGTISNNTLSLTDGERIEIDYQTHKSAVTTFSSYTYNLRDIIQTQSIRNNPNEKFLNQLLIDIPDNQAKTLEQKALFHQKILSPILAWVFSLIAFFLVALAPYVRKIKYSRISILVVFIILIEGIFLSLVNISVTNPLFSYINYVFIIFILFLSIILVKEQQ